MKSTKVKELLMRGIELNRYITKNLRVMDNGLPEWDKILNELSEYDDIVIQKKEQNEFDYLIAEFESGVSEITRYMDKRVVVTKIKASIMEERLNRA